MSGLLIKFKKIRTTYKNHKRTRSDFPLHSNIQKINLTGNIVKKNKCTEKVLFNYLIGKSFREEINIRWNVVFLNF